MAHNSIGFYEWICLCGSTNCLSNTEVVGSIQYFSLE
jgi:hypothetical protein